MTKPETESIPEAVGAGVAIRVMTVSCRLH